MQWEDITPLLREAVKEMREGLFVAGSDFDFEVSMHAVDIMDPKIDNGIGLMEMKPAQRLLDEGVPVFRLLTLRQCGVCLG